ncbi:hypothetical protein LVJ79_05730 [Kingella kingae]|uniref:hypothetical protein n=1 Tax=Kingella kingae TaxID=504 RepID=UPI001FD2880B|nr:hypothetical protein [Kingella kingae]UOP02136.1 hypothetical protein LVJ79_05730 [Kingella kingae]
MSKTEAACTFLLSEVLAVLFCGVMMLTLGRAGCLLDAASALRLPVSALDLFFAVCGRAGCFLPALGGFFY